MTAIPENVQKVIDYAAQVSGRKAEEYFRDDMENLIHDNVIDSPIEQLFWVALHAVSSAQGYAVNPGPVLNSTTTLMPGVYISPQVKIDQFRIDFIVSYVGYKGIDGPITVAVELDGHQFHDRDKVQRSYEKRRDRYLTRNGYRPMHYTGSDVVANPFGVAFEVLEFVVGGLPYTDAEDPLDLGGA